MKILFIGNVDQSIEKTSYANEYLRDTIYHGLMTIPGIEVYTASPIKTVHAKYKDEIKQSQLWGRGFTTTFLLDQDPLIADDVEERIKSRFFDLIIFGDIRVCEDYVGLVEEVYPADRVFCLDGRDDNAILRFQEKKFLYFKRELGAYQENVRPISFSIPACKIASNFHGAKQNYLASVIPFNESTYTFKEENAYYVNMQESFFALTMMKNGWDCMRHYEIMANGCVPVFFNLDNCPVLTLTHFPKHLCQDAFQLFKNFDFFSYMPLVGAFMDFVSKNNTTTRMAEYVLGHAP